MIDNTQAPSGCKAKRYPGLIDFKDDFEVMQYENVYYLTGSPSPRLVFYDEDDVPVDRVLLTEEHTAEEIHAMIRERGVF